MSDLTFEHEYITLDEIDPAERELLIEYTTARCGLNGEIIILLDELPGVIRDVI